MLKVTGMISSLAGLTSLHFTTGSTDTLVSIIVCIGGLAGMLGAKLLGEVVGDVATLKGSL